MARRRYRYRPRTRTRTVYRKVRGGYRKRKGFLTGQMGNFVIGAGAGIVEPMIPQFIGKWTNPAVFGALGYYFKKPALMSIAGYQLGKAITGGGLFGGKESSQVSFEG